MGKVVIIADDLTGANATGVLLAENGFSTATYLSLDSIGLEDLRKQDIISISTDSRSIAPEMAKDAVSKVATFFSGENKPLLYCKRIDSTLRGNIGPELEAVLEVCPNDTIAAIVPAFPNSGRITIGGYLMVDGVPLQDCGLAKDPKNPIHTSKARELISKNSDINPIDISFNTVGKGPEAILKKLRFEIEKHIDTQIAFIFDATTNEHVESIATALSELNRFIVTVDPGPLTEKYSKKILSAPRVAEQKVFLAIGSVTEVTQSQIKSVLFHKNCFLEKVNVPALVNNETRNEEISRVVELISKNAGPHEVLGVYSVGSAKDIIPLDVVAKENNVTVQQASEIINDSLAEITYRALGDANNGIGGLYTSGGDVTVAVTKRIGGEGFTVKDEVLPLAVYGRVINGEFPSIPIVTKGGLIGDEFGLIKCVDYLFTKISTQYSEIKEK